MIQMKNKFFKIVINFNKNLKNIVYYINILNYE